MRNTNKPPYSATDVDYAPKKAPTKKQLQGLIYRAYGLTQEKIAQTMGISRSTVRDHLNGLRKRGISPP